MTHLLTSDLLYTKKLSLTYRYLHNDLATGFIQKGAMKCTAILGLVLVVQHTYVCSFHDSHILNIQTNYPKYWDTLTP